MTSTVFKGLLVSILKTNGILGNTVIGLECRVAAAVGKKKVEVSKINLKPSTKREKITSFISQQKSRQEFPL